MSIGGPSLKLTTYFGERDRDAGGDRFLADALAELYAAHAIRASAVLRGCEGFGIAHRLQTTRLLTLSEDLPLVSVAIDERPRIERLLPAVTALQRSGLVTVERARLLDGALPAADALGAASEPADTSDAADPRADTSTPADARDAADAIGAAPRPAGADALKLTLVLGRRQRAGGRPAHIAVVAALHAAGVDGATVLLGVDGTVRGARERARFLSGNDAVPLLVVAIGGAERLAAALPRLAELLPRPLATLERVRVCKRGGVRLAPPHEPADAAALGPGTWQKLTVHASERAQHAGQPLHVALVRRLGEEGATGATALRGLWGYRGDREPHGDRLLALRRRVPVMTIAVDSPERSARWFELIDELTGSDGLVTSELVPALPS